MTASAHTMGAPLPRVRGSAERTRAVLAAFAALAACIAPQRALAQTQLAIRGDVIAMSSASELQRLRIRAHDGSEVDVQMAFNFEAIELAPAAHDLLTPGEFVSVATVPGTGGSLRALAVLLHFHDRPESSEGHQAWDLAAGSTLTHAAIASVEAHRTARTLTLRDAGGERTVIVDNDVPVAAMLSSGHSNLSAGTHVFIIATRQRDGMLTAGRIYYGKDGYTPPL